MDSAQQPVDDSGESLLRAHHAAASHALRYSAVHAVHLDGWLAKEGKALKTRKTRFVRLNGHVLSSHRSKTAPPSWHVSVAHAVVQKGTHPREITVALPHRVLSFLAPSHAAFENWIVALRRSSLSSSRVEDYYRIGRLVGEGMNGQVRLGNDLLTDEQVAVKMVPRLGRQNETTFLAREIQIVLSVDHPNIVRTIDVFVRSRKIHFVMEYLGGGELFDFIAENTHFTEDHAACVMTDLFNALYYLHSKGVAHRDVKLENLLCANTTWPLNVKLADFGFANYVRSVSDPVLSSFVGTPYYIAPEMLKGNKHGSPVDIWASGVVMYILLSGKFPFGGKNESEYYHRVLTKEAYFPTDEWSNVSEEAKDLVRGMLCKDPMRRLTAEQCLRHPWIRRADTVPRQSTSNHHRSADPMADIATDSATLSTDEDGYGHPIPDPNDIMAASPMDSSVGATSYEAAHSTGEIVPNKRSASSEKQHFLRSPGVFRDNKEKRGKWRYLSMLNHSLSGPTEVVLQTRRNPERRTEKRSERRSEKKIAISVEGQTGEPTIFEDVMDDGTPDETVNRRPSLIRRLLSSGKLSLDRYEGRFYSFRGSMEEQGDEATAMPRKTYSLFSKDGPLRRSFHRGGEHRTSPDDGINFVNSQSQRLPPKVARERQRQQKQATDAMRKSGRGATSIFNHLKFNGHQYGNHHQGYHSSPRLQSPGAHPFSSIPTPAGQRSGTHGDSLISDNIAKNRLNGEGSKVRTRIEASAAEMATYVDLNGIPLPPLEDAALRRTMSADVTPVDLLTGSCCANPHVISRRV